MKIFTAILTSLENGCHIRTGKRTGYFYINTTTIEGQGINRGSGFKGSEVQGSKVPGSKVQGSGFKGSGFRVQRFRVLGSALPAKKTAGQIDKETNEHRTSNVQHRIMDYVSLK
jgi:hypothetical protein